jgi:hypothetical protein
MDNIGERQVELWSNMENMEEKSVEMMWKIGERQVE